MFRDRNPFDYVVFDIRELGKDYKVSSDFSLHEYQSGCGHPIVTLNRGIIQLNQKLRYDFNRVVTLTSGYRTDYYNSVIHGVEDSKHTYGMAGDVIVEGTPHEEVVQWAKENEVGGIGVYDNFTHLDVGGQRIWTG